MCKENKQEEKSFCEAEDLKQKSLIEISVESWRFARIFSKFLGKLDAGETQRYANQVRYFLKRINSELEKFSICLVNIEGQQYDSGMAVSALNSADFAPDDILIVEQMVEPIVMGPDGLIRSGTVMLAKVR